MSSVSHSCCQHSAETGPAPAAPASSHVGCWHPCCAGRQLFDDALLQALAVDRPEFLGHLSLRYHSECRILSLYGVSDAATCCGDCTKRRKRYERARFSGRLQWYGAQHPA